MDIKVSIILPSLNVINYIEECLNSVVNQTLKDIEILCIDAHSTDGTLEVINAFATRDSRIRVIMSPKKSYGYQLNLGFKEAKGEFIGIVETDDYVREDMYEKLYCVARANDCEIVKAGYSVFVHKNGKRVFDDAEVAINKDLYNQVLNPSINANLFDEIHMLNQLGIYKRAFILKNNIALNESPGASYQDNGLLFQLNAFATRLYLLKDILYFLRRDNPNSSVHNRHNVYAPCGEYDFIRAFLQKNPSIEKVFLNTCTKWRFNNYFFAFLRSDDKYKKEFLARFSTDFRKLQDNGELESALSLFNKRERKIVVAIIQNPMRFYRIWLIKKYIKKIPFVTKIVRKLRSPA